jgi:uncharacterized protein YecT (DUF1311 family)
MKKTFVAIAALALSASVFAKDLLSSTYAACMDRSSGVTVEMLDCIGAETERQEAALNKNYQAAMSSLPLERRQKLLAAQRAWLAYRKSENDFTANPDGGTSASVNAADEFLQTTASRADELAGIATQN